MQARIRRNARLSKQGKELNRITLVDELKAIECADAGYRVKKVRDTIDEDAFNTRQRRRTEILGLLSAPLPLFSQ
jgi:hypothetical protein